MLIITILFVMVLTSVLVAFRSAQKLHFDNYSYCKTETSAKCNSDDYKYCASIR